jgi:PAS domain S-box-containing protein
VQAEWAAVSEYTTIPEDELRHLRERTTHLEDEVRWLQTARLLPTRLGETSGVGGALQAIATTAAEVMGAFNAFLYVAAGDGYVFANSLGHQRESAEIDSQLARTVFETREPVELTLASDPAHRVTWAIPVGDDGRVLGVLVVENTEITLADAAVRLDAFLPLVGFALASQLAEHEGGPASKAADAVPRAMESTPDADSDSVLGLRRQVAQLKESIESRTRALRALSRITETVMRANDEAELLHRVCDIVVDVGGYALCWVGLAENDPGKTVRPAASAGVHADYPDGVTVSWGTGRFGRSPAGRSIRRGKPVSVQDMSADPTFAPWSEETRRRGFRSVIGLPLLDSRRETFGSLNIYSMEVGAFDEDESRLLGDLADALAFGIRALRERAARAEAEKQARDAARYARSLFEVNMEPLLLIGPEGRIRDVNRAAELLTGYPRDRLLDSDIAEYFSNPEAARLGYRRVISEGSVKDYPLAVKGASGAEIDVEYSATVFRSEEGELQGVFASIRDVTERKKAQAQEARLAAVVASSQDAILTADFSGAIRSWNEGAERLCGYLAQEVLGASIDVLAPPEFVGEQQHLISRVREGERVGNFETVWVRKGGTRVNVSLTLSPIRDSTGSARAVSVIGRDITERKHAEQIVQVRLRLVDFSANHSLDELLQATLDEAEALTASSIGFYHVAGEDGNELTRQAWSTATLAAACSSEGIGGHLPIAEAGVWADCVREMRPVVHNDYSLLLHRTGVPEGHVPISRELVVPVLRGGRLAAIMGVGNKRTDYDEHDVRTIEALAEASFEIAERKRAQEEFVAEATQRERLLLFNEALMSAIPTPVFYKDRQGRYLGCNLAFSEVMGVTAEEIRGKTVFELWPSELARVYHEADLDLMANPHRQTYEGSVRDKDGVEGPVLFAKDIFRDEAGEVAGVVGAFLELAERARAEEELRKTSEMLRMVLDNMPSQVFWKNREGVYLGCNRLFAENAGLRTPDDILGMTDFDLPWRREAAASHREDDQRVVETGVPNLAYDETRHTAEGRPAVVRTSEVPLQNADGDVIGVLGFEDVIDARLARLALGQGESGYREVLDALPDGAIVLDVADDGRFVIEHVNKAAQEVISADEAGAIGLSYAEVVGGDGGGTELATGAFGEAVAGAIPVEVSLEVVGGRRQATLIPLLGETGRVGRLLVLFRDHGGQRSPQGM